MVLLAVAVMAGAQEAGSNLQFEVASVKMATAPSVDPHILAMRTPPDPPDRFTRRDAPLSSLVVMAYGLKPYEYAGPSWMTSARFDVVAKVPDGATQAQRLIMLRNLLEERFGLKVHREKREMAVYQLVVAKGGPKFGEAVAEQRGAGIAYDADGIPMLPPGGGEISGLPGKSGIQSLWGVMHVEATMEKLASILGSLLGGRPVHDQTGLPGKYDLAMHWALPVSAADGDAAALPLDQGAVPAIFAALQSQLGLKLESAKGMVDVTVVDHCDRTPTGN